MIKLEALPHSNFLPETKKTLPNPEEATHLLYSQLKPKSVIRHDVSVSDRENVAFGHLARFCPHPVSRYAFG